MSFKLHWQTCSCFILLLAWMSGSGLISAFPNSATGQEQQATHDNLIALFRDWRSFERPPFLDGAPDYTAETFERRMPKFRQLQARLAAMDISTWTVSEQVDWHLVRAEMNGFDFNYRVLKPWVRDPAFYQSIWLARSDVPAHEGPTHHAVTELWTYRFPLSEKEQQRLLKDLSVIPPLMKQARINLTGNAKELWIAGIRNIRSQRANLEIIQQRLGDDSNRQLVEIIEASKRATEELSDWLTAEAENKSGPSGIGKDNYTWYQQNVHLVPLTWEDEVRLLKRELDRAWSSLKLEEHRNRHLPQQVAASTPAEYDELADKAASRLMKFLKEQEILTVTNYLEARTS